MNQEYTLPRLLALRKLTRAISELLGGQLRDYLATLGPALRPRAVFGDYIQGTGKEAARAPEKAFKDLQELHDAVIGARPFNLIGELAPPLDIAASTLELTPVEYTHVARSGAETKTVVVTTPLQWTLAYSGFSPRRVKELAIGRNPEPAEVRRVVLHYAVLQVVLARQPGVARMLQALRFPFTMTKTPETGELPLVRVCAPVSTVRPPDDVIIESTELSGKDVFEEIVDLDAIRGLADPLREQLLELARSHGEQV